MGMTRGSTVQAFCLDLLFDAKVCKAYGSSTVTLGRPAKFFDLFADHMQ
jgi:hypothetical protein